MKRILLIGSGGVGTIAAYTLDLCKNVEVTLVARSDYDHVIKNGYKIDSVDYGLIEGYKPLNLLRSIEDAASKLPFEFLVISTKNTPDIIRLEDLVESVVSEKTVIVLLQNGLHIENPFLAKYPKNIVLSGVSMISATNYMSTISQECHDNSKVGYFPNSKLPLSIQEDAALEFIGHYQNGKNTCIYDENVKFTRWGKLVYNATLNPVCALTNLDIGRLEMFGGTDSIVRTAMLEVLDIAKSDGVDLPESIMEDMIRAKDGVYYAPSKLVDIRKGNYTEVEVICGNIIKVARENDVHAPILNIIYNLLLVVQKRTMETKGEIHVPEKRPLPSEYSSDQL